MGPLFGSDIRGFDGLACLWDLLNYDPGGFLEGGGPCIANHEACSLGLRALGFKV